MTTPVPWFVLRVWHVIGAAATLLLCLMSILQSIFVQIAAQLSLENAWKLLALPMALWFVVQPFPHVRTTLRSACRSGVDTSLRFLSLLRQGYETHFAHFDSVTEAYSYLTFLLSQKCDLSSFMPACLQRSSSRSG